MPGYEYSGWYGLFGPANLPREITDRLGATIERLMAQQPLRGRLEGLGGDIDTLGRDRFAAVLEEENRRWARAAAEGELRSE